MFVDSKYRIHKSVNANGQLQKMAGCVSWQAGLKVCQRSTRYFGLLFVKFAVLWFSSCIYDTSRAKPTRVVAYLWQRDQIYTEGILFWLIDFNPRDNNTDGSLV